jgi:membrane peptidoglycan carboxypeptidase
MAKSKVPLHSNRFGGIFDESRRKKIGSIFRSHRRLFEWILILTVVGASLFYEMRTSAFSSRIFSSYAQKMLYRVEPGPSPSIVFPKHGPFDVRAGYALIPSFERRLRESGYRITRQARFSPQLERAVKWGILPPYPEPTFTELTINGMDGQPLFKAPVAEYYFSSFEEIPPLVVKSLLVIENRELGEPVDYRANPVVDWDRLAKAAVFYAGHKLGLPLPVQGGSTLATQMEKYRHANDGRTNSVLAKLRQMTDASLKVYQNGPDTREERRQIVLDYLNSIPLAATPGYGEIHGIGNGLNAWFGLSLVDAKRSLSLSYENPEKAKVYKQFLALLCSAKAPSYYLVQDPSALQVRVNLYVRLLSRIHVILPDFAERVESIPLSFSTRALRHPLPLYAENKAAYEIRSQLSSLLGVPGFYELDRLHLDVESTINPVLQHRVITLFENLHDSQFIDEAGLRGERLLSRGDPSRVVYGMMLFEKTLQGNLLRVMTDNLNAPFNINTGMKMQLGSTAKLRTLVNYLDIVASLYDQFSIMDARELKQQLALARDPITRWAIKVMSRNEKPSLDALLQLALDRRYSASPSESFFTGGGIHMFQNFDKEDNKRILTVRKATERSVNLVYIRLMRDLERYFEDRLPYDTSRIFENTDSPTRDTLLREISEEESRHFLFQAYKAFQKRTPEKVVAAILDSKARSERHQAILFYAWHRGADEQELSRWLEKYLGTVTPEQTKRLAKAYSNPRLDLSDYGYLLGVHPLSLWCAGELMREPSLTWSQIWERSGEARRIASAWLFEKSNRSAQNLRLRIRFERDAFNLMTADWKRLGFPFDRLVPSLATAIGSSGDRPEALAKLMGILVNHGMLKPTTRMTQLRFAAGTPYETVMRQVEPEAKQVLPPAVARAILPVLAQVVQAGTAIRLSGAIRINDRPLVIGGKTGSGDNRFETVGHGGQVISSRPIDRTAVFVFYIEDRYFGVITAIVCGEEAGEYGFTSSLPVAVLKLLAPDIEALWPHPPRSLSENLALAKQEHH